MSWSHTRRAASTRTGWASLGAALWLLAACGFRPPEPPTLDREQVQRGALLFLDARLSRDGTRSCATCHPGGGSDGRLWAEGVEAEVGQPGARRTLPLRGLWQTAPYLWDGSLDTVRAALLRMLAVEMGGAELGETDLVVLEAYVLSIPPFDNGRIEDDGRPREPVGLAARRGAEVFVKSGCAVCHKPPSFSHRFLFDIGTGGKWSVPSLRNVSSYSRFGHDGRWPDLESAVEAILAQRGIELRHPERLQLLRYLELL